MYVCMHVCVYHMGGASCCGGVITLVNWLPVELVKVSHISSHLWNDPVKLTEDVTLNWKSGSKGINSDSLI